MRGSGPPVDLIARRPDVVQGAVLHEPALVALLEESEAEDEQVERIIELAGADTKAQWST